MTEPIDIHGKDQKAYLGGYLDAIKDRDRTEGLVRQAKKEFEEGLWRDASGALWTRSEESGIPITVTQTTDPAYLLLKNPLIFSTPVTHRRGCYICEDPEFAAMGLPLCRVCGVCGGHVAADDIVCDDCGADDQEIYYWEKDPTTTSPYMDLSVDECWP